VAIAGLAYGFVQALAGAALGSTLNEADLTEKSRRVCVIVELTLELVSQVSDAITAVLKPTLGHGVVLRTQAGQPQAAQSSSSSSSSSSGGSNGSSGATSASGPAEPITSLEYVRKPGSLEELLLRENSKVRFVVTTPEGAAKDSFVDCLRILESRDKLGYLFLDEGHLIAES
jgi:hypothetical protein